MTGPISLPARRALLLGALLLGAGCARAVPPAAAPPPADAAPRHLLRPVPVPSAFRAAVGRGTRTTTGAPGARYWQQEVRYRIEAELDSAAAQLRGRAQIVYRNRSPEPIRSVVLNLYQNLFAPGVPRNRFAPETGGMTLQRVAAQGEDLRPLERSEMLEVGDEPAAGVPAGYGVRGTLARVVLPRPLATGDSAVLEVEWRHGIPRSPSFRTVYADGSQRGAAYLVAQWYPQVAVFDDLAGWDATPYLGDGEFYLEWGAFDVSLTVPAGWLVGATGELRNPEAVLTPEARLRLEGAARADTPVHVVTAAEMQAGRSTLRPPGGKVTWRFTADSVRDFAFAASPRYVWDAAAARVADGAGGTRAVPVHVLYRPGIDAWSGGARFGAHALGFFSRALVPYPYPQLTVAEGPLAGGMEYPQLVFVGGYATPAGLHSGIAHEVGHQWMPMLVGQDEAAHAWMDEGLVTYFGALADSDLFPVPDPFADFRDSYRAVAGTDREVPVSRHTDLVSPYGARMMAAYVKPGLLFRSLRAVVGEDAFRAALDAYLREWRFRHPTPWDFFHTVERAAGRDLDWFFYPWWWETGTADLALESVRQTAPGRVRVTVRDGGEIPIPGLVVVTTASGASARAEIPVEAWLAAPGRTASVEVEVDGPAVRVELDPAELFLDADRTNNAWPGPPSAAPAGAAASAPAGRP